MRPLRIALVVALSVPLSACTSGSGHENFKRSMQGQVGRSADDPNVPTNRYPEDRGSQRVLSNGNLEQEYRFAPACKVYFEIDKATRKIIRWRYEGAED